MFALCGIFKAEGTSGVTTGGQLPPPRLFLSPLPGAECIGSSRAGGGVVSSGLGSGVPTVL